MYKRISLRMVDELVADLKKIAKRRGLSMNSLISEMAWEFVEKWNYKYIQDEEKQKETEL